MSRSGRTEGASVGNSGRPDGARRRDAGPGALLDGSSDADPGKDPSAGPDADPDSDPRAGPAADAESVVRAIVLRQLTMAPRSRAQLATKLAQRGAPEDVAQRVLDRFEEVGLVDDAAFAQGWVRSRHTTRGLSRRALAHELRSKGIDDDLARSALDTVDADDERQAAEQLVARRLRAVAGLSREKQVARLAGMLARKGYSGGLAMQVVREALDLAERIDTEADGT